MEYLEGPKASPYGNATCSDNECPCGFPGARIPRGYGYIYVSKSVIDFRRDALTLEETENKVALVQQGQGIVVFSQELVTPTLVCLQGAIKRGLNLELAAADARLWWQTGLVPLRETPLANSTTTAQERTPSGSHGHAFSRCEYGTRPREAVAVL